MAVVVRCPFCERGYRVQNPRPDARVWCKRCGKSFPYNVDPTAEGETAAAAPRHRRARNPRTGEVSYLPAELVAYRVGLIVGGLALAAWWLSAGPVRPHDELFAALDAEYVAITEVVAGIQSPADSEAARPELNRRVAAVNVLLQDPRPFGARRACVAPEVWEVHGEKLSGRLHHLRQQKSRVFNISGAGRAVSGALSQLPQVDSLLRKALTGE